MTAALAWQIFDKLVGKVASYDGTKWKVTVLFSTGHSTAMFAYFFYFYFIYFFTLTRQVS